MMPIIIRTDTSQQIGTRHALPNPANELRQKARVSFRQLTKNNIPKRGNHKGLPLQSSIVCRGNPLWLPLVFYFLGVALFRIKERGLRAWAKQIYQQYGTLQ
jgi:hypothetical protein